jgi:hypothetical protein
MTKHSGQRDHFEKNITVRILLKKTLEEFFSFVGFT